MDRANFAGCGTRPDKLVFIDETGDSTKMARRYGRAKRGQRTKWLPSASMWMMTIGTGVRPAVRDDAKSELALRWRRAH
jgi:hypothetical protein